MPDKNKVQLTETFSSRVRRLKELMGWTNKEMGDKLGVSPEYVGMLMGGRAPGPGLLKLFELVERQSLGDEIQPGESSANPRAKMRQARINKGWSYKELAKQSGCRADVIQAIEEGTGQAPEKVLEKIAAALGLEKGVLMAGQDEAIVRDAVIGTYGAKPDIEVMGGGRVKYVPLLSMAQAGVMGATAFTDEAYDRSGVIAFDVKDPRAFGLKITGDSMEKRYPAGSVAIVYPSHKPRPGRPVIARLKEESGGGVVFKYYNPTEGGRRVTLTSENYQIHPEANYGIEEFEWIYPVANVVIEV